MDDKAFLHFLQTTELYSISLQLSKNTAWMFMAMSHGSIDKSLLLFFIKSCTLTGNINRIPAQQLIQKQRMQTQLSVTHVFLMLTACLWCVFSLLCCLLCTLNFLFVGKKFALVCYIQTEEIELPSQASVVLECAGSIRRPWDSLCTIAAAFYWFAFNELLLKNLEAWPWGSFNIMNHPNLT